MTPDSSPSTPAEGVRQHDPQTRAALEAERRRRQRAERLAAVGELATGVAHEINNPLATIRGFTQLLRREGISEEDAQALDVITAECARIAATVQRLQEFIRVQQGDAGALDVGEAVAEVIELKRYALETAGIGIELDLAPSLSAANAGADAVQRIVLSLLSAVEHAFGSDSRNARIVVRTRESTAGVVLSVSDNGGGLSPEALLTLFSASGPEALESTAALVRELGGEIWADTAQQRGSTYFVRLPRAGDTTGREAPAGRAPACARVLVADDEAPLRAALVRFLARSGHQTVEAADAEEALRLARDEGFGAVLVDLRMPGGGTALLQTLDSLPGMLGRVVVMTGDATHPVVRARIAEGFPVLIKPFDLADAVRIVERIAGEH